MISIEELEKPRSPKEFYKFVKNTFKKLGLSEERKSARIKKGNYKKFIEELYPISIFIKNRYQEDVECQSIKGNQGYDAAILKDNKIINKIEIGWFIEGKAEYEKAQQLNEKGHTEVTLVDEIDRIRIVGGVVKLAKEKSLKDYSDCQLVLILDRNSYFYTEKNAEKNAINYLITEFKKIKFKANAVFLLSLKSNKVIKII